MVIIRHRINKLKIKQAGIEAEIMVMRELIKHTDTITVYMIEDLKSSHSKLACVKEQIRQLSEKN